MNKDTELSHSFKEVYRQFLHVIAQSPTEEDSDQYDMLKNLTSQALYSELSEYLKDTIELNNVKLSVVEDQEPEIFEIYAQEVKFRCGFHIDRQKNLKQLIMPTSAIKPLSNKLGSNFNEDVETKHEAIGKIVTTPVLKNGQIGMDYYVSKLPLMFKDMPLTIVLDFHFKTNIKLNLSKGKNHLLEGDEALQKPEFHQVRFEGLLRNYTNQMKDIVKLKNLHKKQKERLVDGLMPDGVEDWVITNLDGRVEYNDNLLIA
ncbi:hypothetical protein FGO68_gene3933 [Halteria grandinella]|uniref:Uncharacterized protein n=1 Tax=Halteria grandinella TaxID=5974 RepID=A0A8J8NZT6_HALGN|nr:hypothetical protein FGO68_gene3933 [Halteria grandinella]